MNPETEETINQVRFAELFAELSAEHVPIKPAHDKDRLELIGLAILTFQRLEHTLLELVKLLADIDTVETQIVTAKTSFRNLLDIVSALALRKTVDDLDNLQYLVRLAGKAEEIRNQLVHSIWSTGPRFKKGLDQRKSLVTKTEDYSTSDLQAIVTWVDHLDTSLDALAWRYVRQCRDSGVRLKNVRFV